VNCPRCECENRADARFCDSCGHVLPGVCADCGRVLRDEARFCDGCGHAVEAASAPSALPEAKRDPRAYTPSHIADRILNQRSAVEGERKHVTVLFADLVDSTPLVGRMDPEEVHALMDRAFQSILDTVHHYEGTVNQFLGDGVMALFGAPLALEDAPRRAVLAALAIQRGLDEIDADVRREHGSRFRMRIGIHSGFVVVGRIGDDLRMDYTAVGDTTHLADRIQARAQARQVVISDHTRSLVEGFFELHDLGVAMAKGFPEPVRAWEVVSELGVRDRVEAGAAAGLTPFVGRELELGTLLGAFESALDGRGQVVVAAGEAGIGKSRLLYEFRSRLQGEPHTWVEGRCSSYAVSTALLAVADALRGHFGIEDRDDESAAIARLEEGVAALGDDLRWCLPFLRTLLSLSSGDADVDALDGMVRRSETVRGLQALLLRLSQKSPLVFVVEDLHWIDPASEELLTWMVNVVPASRILMVLTCRPRYQPPFGEPSYLVRLAVQPLSTDSMSSMAGALVEGETLPQGLLEIVTEKAEGNPFFVEEILKSLVEDGTLALEDGRATLQRDIGEISVPDSIHDVLMARLDRLADEPKRAIQVASVIGREFALRLLAAIREAGDRIQDVVGELRSLELIYEKAAHPELAFMFKHALTHDVAYDSILQARRKGLHRIVGLAIEELYADRIAEHYEALAHHFERSEEWLRAYDYHVRAARRAGSAFASRSAIEHFEAALALLDRVADAVGPDDRVDLEEELGSYLSAVSEFARSADALERAAAATEDASRRARDLSRAATAAVFAHQFERVDELAARSRDEARRIEDLGSEAIAVCAVGMAQVALRGPAGVSDLSLEAIELAERSGDPEAIMPAHAGRSLFLELHGRFGEAMRHAELATRAAQAMRALEGRKLARGPERAFPQWIMGLSLIATGEYGRALGIFRAALEVCERCGDRAIRARLLNTIGWLYSEVGADDLALDFNEQSAEMAKYLIQLGRIAAAPEVRANAVINLAGNWAAMGEPARARDWVEPLAESIGAPGSDPWNQWRFGLHVQHALARVALAEVEPERALAHLDAELEGARRQDLKKLEARSLELRARCFVTMDDRAAAAETVADARAVAQEIGYVPVLWRTDSLALELARRAGDGPEAERRAAAIHTRIDAAAETLDDDVLRPRLLALGARLTDDPLTAHH
jgi:class 3 adenylate cyclase/tetratricopeptide (TPR) repeat protein